MLIPLLVLQIVTLLALLFLLFRRPAAPQQDPRAAQLPDQVTRLEEQLRISFTETRGELRSEIALNRQAADTAAIALRGEITQSVSTLGHTLKTDLNSFREDNTAAAERLRNDVEQRMRSISQGFADLKEETTRKHTALQEALNSKLVELMGSNTSHQDKLRTAVEASLAKLNTDNSSELEKMRQTVDEKLQTTLHARLTESFGQVTDQLTKVHSGLGEMTRLSEGVNDLSRIFSNVKSRGGFAEVQLGMLLEQMLAPSQFVRNAKVKPGSQEVVEFAVRFPGHSGETLLPIDAKFPREDWERLEAAYESNNPELLASAGKAFESAIRTEGERICKKYINPPVTTPHAIMFLPTEGLYAEVMRRDALQAEIQSKCQVTIAGPSTLSAILTSFQMGFHMLAIQEKGDEVWKVLAATKTEFGKFGTLMSKMEDQVGTVQNTIQKLGVRTRAIDRTLREVSEIDSSAPSNLLSFEEIPGVAPLLAATSEED
jgi:DNA recombination protein RmuC